MPTKLSSTPLCGCTLLYQCPIAQRLSDEWGKRGREAMEFYDKNHVTNPELVQTSHEAYIAYKEHRKKALMVLEENRLQGDKK